MAAKLFPVPVSLKVESLYPPGSNEPYIINLGRTVPEIFQFEAVSHVKFCNQTIAIAIRSVKNADRT